MSTRANHMMTCQELVELVSEYLEGRMDAPTRARFDEHLAECAPCVTYVDQMRATVDALGHLPPESLSAAAERELLEAFRDWRAER